VKLQYRRSVGEQTQFQPGDRVIGQLPWGGMAEKAVVPASKCLRMPKSMTFEQASAFLNHLRDHLLRTQATRTPAASRHLLILGAAGGVGLAAVQLGAALGARVIAAAPRRKKLDLCRQHGALEGLSIPTAAR